MNRTNKFRAKRKLNGKWVYGSLIKGDSEDWDFIVPLDFDTGETIDSQAVRVITKTIGQLTPFKDDKDNDVWEGDSLLTYGGNTYEVYFDKKYQFSIREIKDNPYDHKDFRGSLSGSKDVAPHNWKYLVTGTIHD